MNRELKGTTLHIFLTSVEKNRNVFYIVFIILLNLMTFEKIGTLFEGCLEKGKDGETYDLENIHVSDLKHFIIFSMNQ